MKSILLRSYSNQVHSWLCEEEPLHHSIDLLKDEIFQAWGIPVDAQALYHNGKLINSTQGLQSLASGALIDVNLRLQGGKGGFGSLLRGQAISKRKITNFDASRDLQGRRIRNVKYQQKIMEWVKKKKEEEKLIKKEVDEYNKMQKTIQGVQKDIRLTQEFKDKVEKWDTEMTSSIRAGIKKAKKKAGDKRGQDDVVLDDFEEPKKKKKVITEKTKQVEKGNPEWDDLDKKISEKIAALIDDVPEKGQNGKSEEVKDEQPEVKEDANKEESNMNGKEEKKKEEVVYEPIDLKAIKTIDDLIKLGSDHLKHELMRLGLKCGGNLQEKAKRLYDVKLDPGLFMNPKYIAKKKE